MILPEQATEKGQALFCKCPLQLPIAQTVNLDHQDTGGVDVQFVVVARFRSDVPGRPFAGAQRPAQGAPFSAEFGKHRYA